ncbi:hypothetical protein ABK040_006432 [Willaertia magna]
MSRNKFLINLDQEMLENFKSNEHLVAQMQNQIVSDYLPPLLSTYMNCSQYLNVDLMDPKRNNQQQQNEVVVSEVEYLKQFSSCITKSLCPNESIRLQQLSCLDKIIDMNKNWQPGSLEQDQKYNKELRRCLNAIKRCTAEFVLNNTIDE